MRWNDERLVALNPSLKDVDRPVLMVLHKGKNNMEEILDAIIDSYASRKPFTMQFPETGSAYQIEDTYSKVQSSCRGYGETEGEGAGQGGDRVAGWGILSLQPDLLSPQGCSHNFVWSSARPTPRLQIEAVVMETEYTVAITRQGALPGSDAYQTAAIYPETGGVPLGPSLENMKGCFTSQEKSQGRHQILDAYTSSSSCYPLSLPIYVALNTTYEAEAEECDDIMYPVRQTIRWWQWMLLANNIEAPMDAENILHMQSYGVEVFPSPSLPAVQREDGGISV